jgi:hypothetical protein
MAFNFVDKNGKPLKQTLVEWKFEEHTTTFKSEPEKFERNIAFWKNKLGLKDPKVEILNGNIEIEIKETIKVEEYVNNISEPVATEPAIESPVEFIDRESDAQSDLSELAEDIIDTPKRKSRKKTS